MAFASVNGMKIHYEIRGTGPCLLFIHGIGADLENPVSIFNFPLAEHYTVLAFDPRGLGESESETLPGTIAEMADDAAGLAMALGWDNYHVLGASMGGMVAQELALKYPNAVQKLVLVVTSAGGKAAAAEIFDKMEQLPLAGLLRISDTRQDEAWMAANPEKVELFKQVFTAQIEARHMNPLLMRSWDNQVKAIKEHNTFHRLPQIKAPTLVIGGRYDGGCPLELTQALAAQIPGARFEPVESGHGGWLADQVLWETIIRFLYD